MNRTELLQWMKEFALTILHSQLPHSRSSPARSTDDASRRGKRLEKVYVGW